MDESFNAKNGDQAPMPNPNPKTTTWLEKSSTYKNAQPLPEKTNF